MTTISSVVLVDKRIQDYETIVSAVKADGVRAIVFDVGEIDTHCAAAEGSSSFQYILNEIAALGATSFLNIGIVQHNTGAPFHRFFAMTHGENSTVVAVEAADPTLQTWAGFAAFVTTLKNTYGVQNVDLMACALYSDPNWKYVIDTLAVQTGVTVRASTDDTGAAALGGDWFLESHTGVNLKDVYFTEAIENFSGVLIYTTKYDSSSLFTTKSFAVGKVTAWGAVGSGGNINTITGDVITSGVVALYSSTGAFAALKTNGSVSTWGDNASGGNQRITSGGMDISVASNLTSGVVEIFSTQYSMAALKSDGTVITWGHSSYGGVSSSVDLTNVVDIYSDAYIFAALKSNGRLVTWGDANFGGNSSEVAASLSSDVVSMNILNGGLTVGPACAALKSNGSLVTWPTTSTSGGNSSAVASSISSGVMVLYTDGYTFAALKNNGSLIYWGATTYGGNPRVAAPTLTNIVSVNGRGGAYAALTTSGSVLTWGLTSNGGDSSGKSLSSNVVKVYNNGYAFAALKFDGSVVTWGYSTSGADSTSVASDLSSGVVAIYGNSAAFAALKSNGRVITWGSSTGGANSSSVATDISAGIVAIYAGPSSFAALRNDGKLITWGGSTSGGDSSSVSTDLSAGVVIVNNTGSAFAAITSSATTFDLSASYYRDIDRYNILRNKENRRRANLTTLNNNVFTLSAARDIQKFNYTIPSGNSFRIIIPDYVSSNYSIISTASIPSPAAANYIIACEEGEPVTISGTTYINYGAFVYRRNADNTFTKMVTATIGGYTYSLYGGDGIFSSGIALRYRFAIPDKIFGDASFNITAPLTDSSGAFTYTSSNATVATVTTGGTVTIVAAGNTTITATQAASGSYPSESIPTTLVVNKFVSTLGALTVPAKLAGDAPFTLTTPTSTTSSIVSPVNMITSTASMIVPPPDSRDISYGTTWTQRGQDIDGEATDDRSGWSVSMSADGTVLAIGAPYNAGTVGNSQRGHVRIYAWNGSSWVQRGADIDGEAYLDKSGTTVSLSANGNVVAIGAYLNDGTVASSERGHVRVYAWNGTSWIQRGADIDGESTYDFFGGYDGTGLSISADGTIVAIGAYGNDGTTGNIDDNRGHVRIYSWNGTTWTQRGQDIDGEAAGDESGTTVSMSADGTVVAIGAPYNDVFGSTSNRGHVRIYAWNGTSWIQRGADIDGPESEGNTTYRRGLSISADGTIVAIGAANTASGGTRRGNTRIYVWNGTAWIQRGADINGEADYDYSGYSVSLTSNGTIVAIGAYGNDQNGSSSGHVRIYAWNGTSWIKRGQDIDGEAASDNSGTATCISSDGTVVAIGADYNDGTVPNSNRGHVRVYQIATTNSITYTSSDSSIADVYGNLLLIKGVDGTSAITASQSGNTYTWRLDVSGTTYTLQYNAITYTSSNTDVATVSTYGTVTITGGGTSTITATQPETLNYASRSVSATLDVSRLDSTLGALTVPAKLAGDAPFTLTAPTSTVSSIISPVNTITSTASVMLAPPDSREISYGTTWSQLGLDISGTQVDERSGTSVSISADGTIVAIGSSVFNTALTDVGRTRVYKYNGTSWSQLGSDIVGIQVSEQSGISVSLSADGTTVAIGSFVADATSQTDVGLTRVYKYNGTSWIQLGLNIFGNQASEQSGISVSLSADGTIVAVGSPYYDKAGGTTNSNTSEGRTRVYKYNGILWIQLGLDISGNQVDERSGYNVSLSADGMTVAIGSYTFNVTGSNEGRTRVFKYNGTSWGQLGSDISGNQADETSGISVCLSADGTIVAIGSSGFNTTTGIVDAGRTRVFQFNGTSWSQLGSDISGNQTSEESGNSVSLSADGTIVAVGSYIYDRAGGTTNAGTNEGRTRVYKYNGTSWSQLGLDISANQVDERAGYSVSLSSDGTTVAIGSPFYDSAGGTANSNTSQGRTRIYNIATTNSITYTSSSSSIADVCGNMLLIKGLDGTSTITASQSGNTYTGRLDVSGTTYTLQYNAITYTISDASLATVSTYGTVTLTGATGTSTITATQPETRNYASKSVSATLNVSRLDSTLGALTVPAKLAGDEPFTLTAPTSTVSSIISPVNTITSTASMIPTPPEIQNISYGTTWLQWGADIVGTQVDERSGTSVSMSADGTIVAIGSSVFNTAIADVGRTRVYKYNGTSWSQLGSDIVGIQVSEQSGISVSLSADGTTVAIGSFMADGSQTDVGLTRVYKYNGTSWVQLGLNIFGNQASEQSGISVSLSADGTIVAVGSFAYDRAGGTTNAGTTEGRTRVYKYNGIVWIQLGLDISGNQVDERSGYNVSLSADGTTVAIGSYTFNVTGSNEGRTRVFKYNGTSWGQLGLDISGNQADETSGISVSLSADGTIVAIGSSGFNTTTGIVDAGRTRVFQFNGTSWSQLGSDISGNQTSEESGNSVSLSADGTIVAVGSYVYDMAGGSTNAGTNEGRTRIYKYNGTSWNQLGLEFSANQVDERSGYSVSLSSDGTTVAIGSPFYDSAGGTTNAGTSEGRTRVYQIASNALTYTSSSSSIADVCGNILLIKGLDGTSTITASQSGNTYTGRLDVSGTTYTLQYNAITYTISDASLATVSTYGTVTLTGATGTSTITATQPQTRNYASKSVTATLDVSRLDSTLGTLTVPAKLAGDAPFTLTAPTSTVSSIISPVNTITSTVGIIPMPPETLNISYGTTWNQLGLDISGTQVDERSGTSVSMSADGTVVAIGSFTFNVTGSNEGRTRVFKYNGTSWSQLGLDISGNQADEHSGFSVSLSADGTIVAIGSLYYDRAGGTTNSSTSEGRTRVYKYNGTSWSQLGLDISGNQTTEQSGSSVCLSADGTIVAIGSPYYDRAGGTTNSSTSEGRTRVFKYNGTSWSQLGLDISGNQADERSGYNVSLSADGTTVAIGSYTFNVTGSNEGRTRVFKYNGTSWIQLGLDISGNQADETSGVSVCLSADGTIVAIGSNGFNHDAGIADIGRTRVFQFNGTSWSQLGSDILGNQISEESGFNVSLSADGTIVAIGSYIYDRAGGSTNTGTNEGRTRVYKYNGTSWNQLGLEFSANQVDEQAGYSVSLSSDGTTVAIGSPFHDRAGGTTNAGTSEGRTRVYQIASNALTYSSSSSSIADVCGNLLLIKGVNGTSTITASQTGNTITGRLDVSGTTYTLQYNPTTYTISDASLATVSTYGTVTLTGAAVGTSTITATQPQTRNYASKSVTATLDVSGIVTVLGALTIPTKAFGDASFNLTAPTTNNPSGAFTYTSSNTAVATVTSGGVVTIVGTGTTTITASQATSGLYTSASVSGSLVVNFGNTSSITRLLTDGAYVIPTPVSNIATTYGSIWNQLGADTVGKVSGDESGTSISVSADGTIVAIGARSNTTNRGTVRVYKYNDVSWNQIGSDINGEASSDYSGQSVSLSANGRVLAIGANMNDGSGNLLADSGHVRIYEFNGTTWVQRGGDIDGEAAADQSGISVSLSADGSTVAIGAIMNDGSGNALSNSGHVRVYRYNASKTSPQLTDQSAATFGPAGWDRLGADIDGEAVNDQSGFSVSISVDGTIVAIGAIFNDGTSGTVDTSNNRGHVRVYRYNASKTSPQLTNQSLTTFGPAGWDRMGSDIDGEVAADQSGFSVSLSADGSAVAIGSPLYDVSGVANSGRVRVFAWNGSAWTQRGQNINGVNLNENVGDSVSLSADGSILSVSSFMKVVNYNYNSSTNTWSQIGANLTGTSATTSNITNATLYSPHVYLDATNPTSYNRTTNTWTNIGSVGGNVVMTNMVGNFDASDNGGSFNFNGSTNRGQLTVPSTTLSSITYLAVVKTTRLNTSYATIIEFGANTLLFNTNNNGLNLYPSTTSTFSLAAGVWYVLAVTKTTGGSITGYVNGVSVFTGTYTGTSSTTSTVYGIGSGLPTGDEYWNGKISAIAVYHNRVLTASEIANVSNNFQTYRVSLSSQGNILAVGAREYDGATGTSTNVGVARVYRIDTSGNYTFSSNNTAIADVCGNIILPKSAGSTTIAFTQSASGETASRSGTIAFSVSGITPTFGAFTIPAKNFGDAAFSLTAPTSDSSGAFTYDSSNTAVATVTSGGTVTIVGVGSTTITATQAESGNYAAGSVTASLMVSAIEPTIGELSVPAKNFGDAAFDLTAPSSNSGGAFTYESSNTAVATVTSGGTVTVVGAGTTTITVTQAASADGNYTGGSSVTGSLVVSAIAPTYQSITQITKTYSTDVSFSLLDVMTGISNSNGAYTFSSESDAVDICGGVATILAYTPSAITITASQEASGNYASSSKTFTLLVNRKTPSYGAFSVPAATYEDAPFSIAPYAPTTDSTLVPFTYTSSDPNVATISTDGTVVTIIGQGYTTITASQDASGNYAASSTTTSFLVNRAAPTFLKAFTIPNKTFGDASFSLLPFTDGLDNTDGTYHFTSSNAQLVSISEADGVTATIHAYTPTPITIYVAIDACGNYAASSTSGTLTVLRATPTFGAFTVPVKNFRDASFNLTAPTSDSSGAFTYTSSNTSVATVTSSGGVTIIGAGNTTITATQEINGNYTTRDISAALVVSPIAPSIGALTAPAKNFGDVSFNLTEPTSDSSGAFTYTSSNTAVATVTSDGTVTIIGVGSTTITATQAGSADGNYTTGSVSASLVVSASLRNFSVPAKTYGDASFNLVDPDTTDNTVGFTFASSNTAVATLSGVEGRTVTITGAGSTVITATQAATASRGQLDISATLVVSKVRPVITIAPITKAYGNPSFRPVPTTTNTDTSGGSVFTFTSNNIAVVSMLDTSLVRINGVGTATLSITQAASANFTDASGTVVVTVNKGVSGLSASTFAVPTNKTFGDAAFAITTKPISSSTGAITYSSSDEAVATVRSDGSGNSAITVVGQGTVTFTASQAESALYTADTKTSNTLTVARKTAALSRDTPSVDTISKSYGDAAFTVTATNESNGAFSFASSDPSFATIDVSTGEVTIVAVGSTTLTATRAQTAQYNAASVSWTLNIARGTTTLTGLSSLTRNVTVAPFSVSASSESDGAVSYALQDQSSTVLTIHPTSGLITLLSPGSAVIVASQAQGTLYEAPASITATITVSEAGNTLEGSTLTGSNNYANVDLSGGSLANANITNTNFSSGRLDNSNFSGATISGANMSSSELSNASFNNATVNNTNFTSGILNNANMNGASITNSNMTSADLSDATMRGSTMTGTDFTSAILRRTDLSGANVRGSIFNSADLSGAILTRLDASGASFINADLRGANLSNANFTNANMTNANISGADITNVTFTVGQKLQLLKNRANRLRSEIQVSQVLGSVLLPVLSAGSAVRDVPNVANATFKVVLPTTSLVSSDTIPDITLDISNFAYFYFPIGENEYFQIQGVKYYISGSTVRNFATGVSVENTSYGVKAIRLLAGSLTIIVNSQNTLSSSSFVVPSIKQNTDAPFSPTTLPTSNSSAPIVYTSNNTSVATIDSSSGIITPVADACGFVRFTASQVATETHESASITSNELFINKKVDLTLVGLNQTFSLSTLASLDASSITVESTDATAVFYVRLSDMTNLFQYQTDSFDVNNLDASDVKYYVFHRTMPAELHINPSHAMMNKTESAGMLGVGVQEISAAKSLVKHDFIRYIALRLFNTHYGVDLFQNEQELQENITYLGETVQHNIDTILSGISTTSAVQDMAYDASGNKYLTNDASGNTNLCRELMRQIAANEPSRLYNNGGDISGSGIRAVPLREDDSINFKLTITAAESQNIVTGVSVIPSRTYLIKMVLKNTVNTVATNTNTAPTDSEMYPNSYPYSTAVTTYAPTGESSSGVYNVYSPPAPIPTSRFGYNGWYYTNSTTWVNLAPAVRDRVKWVLSPNAAGASTVADLRYIRMNLKVYNKTSLPFIVVTTQAGSYRKYTISAPNSLTNGTVYSFYMNFNSYVREPATIGATNAALTYSGVSNGSFDNSEIVASIAVETDSEAATSSVEFTLSSVIVGESSGEKEHGFSAIV